MTNYQHTSRPSRAYSSPLAHVVFYTFLDALAFILGVLIGSFALGYAMAVYFFGL